MGVCQTASKSSSRVIFFPDSLDSFICRRTGWRPATALQRHSIRCVPLSPRAGRPLSDLASYSGMKLKTHELSRTRLCAKRALVGGRHGMRGGGSVVRLCAHRRVRWLARSFRGRPVLTVKGSRSVSTKPPTQIYSHRYERLVKQCAERGSFGPGEGTWPRHPDRWSRHP